jgi:hypothetical protein
MSDTRSLIALWVGFDVSWKVESDFPRNARTCTDLHGYDPHSGEDRRPTPCRQRSSFFWETAAQDAAGGQKFLKSFFLATTFGE